MALKNFGIQEAHYYDVYYQINTMAVHYFRRAMPFFTTG